MQTEPRPHHGADKVGLAGKLARMFVDSKLTLLFVLGALLLGVAAVQLTPREEEPQIVVPMVDVVVAKAGASAREMETQITTPLERQLWGISGVEYLYSTSMPGRSLVTVRFKVNEPLEASLVKVQRELGAHPELLPDGVSPPTVRVLTVDDVPFLTLTLHGEQPPGVLRQLGEAVARELSSVPDTAQVRVLGGARRQVRVEPNLEKLRAAGVTLSELARALRGADSDLPAGATVAANHRSVVEVDGLLRSAGDLKRLVVVAHAGRPVYLGDVAEVVDGPEPEPALAFFAQRGKAGFESAVTVVLSKRPGANATALSRTVEEKLASLRRGTLLPHDVAVSVTRNYGETAGAKARSLIEHLLIATLSVVVLILLAMGWRSAVVVGITVPTTLSLTLLLTYLLGYTLNRVTLFALIFSIGILVDDAIVVMENVHRHLHLPGPRRGLVPTIVQAVDEVGNPTILATFAVIAAILPMAFVRGLMGPYMRPIPVGASLAMLFSLVIAFVVSPWASRRLFRSSEGSLAVQAGAIEAKEGRFTLAYRRLIRTLLRSAGARWAFLALVLVLFAAAASLVATGRVKVKMLPFDNKSEFQVQLDLPAGTAQQSALVTGQAVARRLLQDAAVLDVEVYSGAAAPFTFVGLVRHSFLRDAPEQVDLQVNLVPKEQRQEQSHALVTRLRPDLEAITAPAGARMKLVEIPPGPPVLDTMVAEVYGPEAAREALAGKVREAFRTTPGLVDLDSSLNPTSPRTRLVVDREKAALLGVAPSQVTEALSIAGAGLSLGTFPTQNGNALVPLLLQLPLSQRTELASLLSLEVPGARGPVPSAELVQVVEDHEARALQHKNLMPVSYVVADLAGQIESPIYALAALNRKLDALGRTGARKIERYGLSLPLDTEHPSLKWDGEWHVTLEVFRDLGLAFAAVLVLIYVLVVGWFKSFTLPWVILVPIPLSLIGILPAHGLAGAFFTATSMIGFIAGAGIIVRNSIILVDFIELKVSEGMQLELAVEEAGVVRFRPMLLTAAAVMVGSSVMLTDPIFQGLAISLMAGEVAATLLSRIAVPVLYFLVSRREHATADDPTISQALMLGSRVPLEEVSS